MKPLLDSSTLIFNFEYPHSNSRIIFDLVLSKRFKVVVSEKAITEVKRVLGTKKDARFTHLLERMIRKNCEVIPRTKIAQEMNAWKGKIKEKDLEHLATAKFVHADYIVAFDRDFLPYKEYRTPKQFVEKILKLNSFQTEY